MKNKRMDDLQMEARRMLPRLEDYKEGKVEIDVKSDDGRSITFYFEKMYGLRYENSSDWVCTGSIEHKSEIVE